MTRSFWDSLQHETPQSRRNYGIPQTVAGGATAKPLQSEVLVVLECNYEINCTTLYKKIEDASAMTDWEAIIQFLDTGYWPGFPSAERVGPKRQAMTWVTSFGSFKENHVRYSQLPLHLAIVCGAPFSVLGRLIDLYPDAVCCTDDEGMLPIHLALRHGASKDTVNNLLLEFPGSVNIQDKFGFTPIQLNTRANVAQQRLETSDGRDQHSMYLLESQLRPDFSGRIGANSESEALLEIISTDSSALNQCEASDVVEAGILFSASDCRTTGDSSIFECDSMGSTTPEALHPSEGEGAAQLKVHKETAADKLRRLSYKMLLKSERRESTATETAVASRIQSKTKRHNGNDPTMPQGTSVLPTKLQQCINCIVSLTKGTAKARKAGSIESQKLVHIENGSTSAKVKDHKGVPGRDRVGKNIFGRPRNNFRAQGLSSSEVHRSKTIRTILYGKSRSPFTGKRTFAFENNDVDSIGCVVGRSRRAPAPRPVLSAPSNAKKLFSVKMKAPHARYHRLEEDLCPEQPTMNNSEPLEMVQAKEGESGQMKPQQQLSGAEPCPVSLDAIMPGLEVASDDHASHEEKTTLPRPTLSLPGTPSALAMSATYPTATQDISKRNCTDVKEENTKLENDRKQHTRGFVLVTLDDHRGPPSELVTAPLRYTAPSSDSETSTDWLSKQHEDVELEESHSLLEKPDTVLATSFNAKSPSGVSMGLTVANGLVEALPASCAPTCPDTFSIASSASASSATLTESHSSESSPLSTRVSSLREVCVGRNSGLAGHAGRSPKRRTRK